MNWGRQAQPGWRSFECEDCGCKWKESCRDAPSLSGSDCPKCHEFTSPNGYKTDDSVSLSGPFDVIILDEK